MAQRLPEQFRRRFLFPETITGTLVIDLDILGFLIGYSSICALALWLLDRSHQRSFAKFSQIYDQQTAREQALLRTLNSALDSLKKEEG